MNLDQIAKLSGVSRSTVSRVLNHDPRVSPATRKKVEEVVRSMEAAPKTVERTNIIGLVVRDLQRQLLPSAAHGSMIVTCPLPDGWTFDRARQVRPVRSLVDSY
jgi:DNA-binding LacI/PurR family transcriptional regulator